MSISVGAAIGIAVGVAAVVAGIVALIIWLVRRARNNADEREIAQLRADQLAWQENFKCEWTAKMVDQDLVFQEIVAEMERGKIFAYDSPEYNLHQERIKRLNEILGEVLRGDLTHVDEARDAHNKEIMGGRFVRVVEPTLG
jgi:uncharacterized membrane protein YhiD involved in acid resistance